jgi:hypothetical protein
MRYLLLTLLTLFCITNSHAMKRKYASQAAIETNHHMISSRDLGFLSLNDFIARPNTIYLNENETRLSFEVIEEFFHYKLNKKWTVIKNHLNAPVKNMTAIAVHTEWYLFFQIALFLTSRDSASHHWFQKYPQEQQPPKRARLEQKAEHKPTTPPHWIRARDIGQNSLQKYKDDPSLEGAPEDIQALIAASLHLFGQTPQTFSSQFFIQPLTGKIQTEGNTFDPTPYTGTLLKLACALNLIQKRGFAIEETPLSHKHVEVAQQRPSSAHSATSGSSTSSQTTQEIIPLAKVASSHHTYQGILDKLKREILNHRSAFLKAQNDQYMVDDRSRHFCLFFASYFLAIHPQGNFSLGEERYNQILCNTAPIPGTLNELLSLSSFCANDIPRFYGLSPTELLNQAFYNRSSKSWIVPYRANLPSQNKNWPPFLANIISQLDLLDYFKEDDDIIVLAVKTSLGQSRGL